MTNRVFRVIVGVGAVITACKGDKPVDPGVGPPSQVVEVSPISRTALANAVVGTPITVAVKDASGHGIAGEIVTFSVIAGGGSLTGNLSDTTDANGRATAPSWRLGKSADGTGAQKLRAVSGSLTPLDISATVTSSYNIVVRFYDAGAMTAAQQAVFTAAAQRIMGVVTGDVSPAQFAPPENDVSSCLGQPAGTTRLTETVDDIVIYATAKAIDGVGQVLGSAGPCYIRDGCAAGCDKLTVMGVMSFDIADIADLQAKGSLQDVITHEMLHVLGVGSLWGFGFFNFLSGAGTLDPQYTAAQARAGCTAVGGTLSCANTVPVEGCATEPKCQPTPQEPDKGSGTRDSHWREDTFNAELMTGFLDVTPVPFSSITVGALQDMGYAVNTGDNDTYTIFVGSIRASSVLAPGPSPLSNWEGLHRAPLYSIDRAGKVRLLRKAQ